MLLNIPSSFGIIAKKDSKIVEQIHKTHRQRTIYSPADTSYMDYIVRCQYVINKYGKRQSTLKSACEAALADGRDYLIVRVYLKEV